MQLYKKYLGNICSFSAWPTGSGFRIKPWFALYTIFLFLNTQSILEKCNRLKQYQCFNNCSAHIYSVHTHNHNAINGILNRSHIDQVLSPSFTSFIFRHVALKLSPHHHSFLYTVLSFITVKYDCGIIVASIYTVLSFITLKYDCGIIVVSFRIDSYNAFKNKTKKNP